MTSSGGVPGAPVGCILRPRVARHRVRSGELSAPTAPGGWGLHCPASATITNKKNVQGHCRRILGRAIPGAVSFRAGTQPVFLASPSRAVAPHAGVVRRHWTTGFHWGFVTLICAETVPRAVDAHGCRMKGSSCVYLVYMGKLAIACEGRGASLRPPRAAIRWRVVLWETLNLGIERSAPINARKRQKSHNFQG
ncbi:hypothetical protein VTK26DRAFT_5831 [Humicola hyalothermophila]